MALAAFVCTVSAALATTDSRSPEKTVAYSRIQMGDYQNFLTNWDDKRQPLLYAVIETAAHYETLFHPAGLNGGNHRFAPEPELFGKEEILVVGRVLAAPKDMDKVFDVETVTEAGPVLTLHYRFHDPHSHASFTVKDYLAVRVPKGTYDKVVFVENGKVVGELAPAKGSWSVPQVKAER